MPAALVQHAYGKSAVRLTRVIRHPDRHEVRELTVAIQLDGDFDASYTSGDNSQIIATDTMRNVVYALAHGRPAEAIEEFAAALAGHFVDRFGHVRSSRVELVERPWHRIVVQGVEHPHAFVGGGGESRVAVVEQGQGEPPRVTAGLSGLDLLKTAGSGFVGFLRDEFTTLPATTDRIFATEVQARWVYTPGAAVAWDDSHAAVRRAFVDTFATHDSHAVQQTLHAMGAAALAACPAIAEVALTLPNRHRVPFDLARLGRPNDNTLFVPTAEPFGLISGTLRRL